MRTIPGLIIYPAGLFIPCRVCFIHNFGVMHGCPPSVHSGVSQLWCGGAAIRFTGEDYKGGKMTPDRNVIYRDLGRIPLAKIVLIADVHLSAEECEYEMFESMILDTAKDKTAFVVLVGDLIDNGTKGSVTGPYGQTMRPSEAKKQMAKTLAPVRDQILCIIPGNHEGRSAKEVDDCPAYDIASKLDLEDIYRENAAYLALDIGKDTAHQRPYRYYGLAQHGSGGGKYIGASINNFITYAGSIDGLDFAMMGHTHKPFAVPDSRLLIDPVNKVMRQHRTLYMGANSWLHYGGYGIRYMFRPTAMPGSNKMIVYGDKNWFEAVI
jgi:predicted phosphodiesterase